MLRRAGFLRRALGSLQTRIVLVILLSVLPLVAISSLLAWQDYEWETALGERRIGAMMVQTLTRVEAAVDEAASGAGAIARVPGVTDAAGCADALHRFTDFTGLRTVSLRVARADGSIICGIGTDGIATIDGFSLPPGGVTEIERASRAAGGGLLLPVVFARTTPDHVRITIMADLLVQRAFGAESAWILPSDGILPLRLAGTLPPPRPATLDMLLRGAGIVTERHHGAPQRGFMIGRLPDGSALVLGDEATRKEAAASAILFWRFTAIALLLALGVIAITIAGHLGVGAPIRELTDRVTRWRKGEGFDEHKMRFLPVELIDLQHAFALATTGIIEREAALEKARGEQDLLIKEIHHRVKNNLQIIASLLNLQASRIRLPEAKAEFQSARDRVRALATLHRHLYADGGLHTIVMRSFLLELCGQLFQAIGEREGHRIRLEVEAPELQMSSDQAVPLALVVTEAVSNAVKYAFPGGRSGHVSVCLTELADDMLELVIQDDGVGIPAGRAETETGIRDGLGIQLIRGFARQLNADLVVTEDGGTRYQLKLKLHRLHEDYPASVPA